MSAAFEANGSAAIFRGGCQVTLTLPAGAAPLDVSTSTASDGKKWSLFYCRILSDDFNFLQYGIISSVIWSKLCAHYFFIFLGTF
jgi:hypothetical protein